ncbi:glucose-6-phosphate isomerase [Geminisphaera colitermitum]|uniref:glucose-6-phosphate isomerase n=1 Tax=Geminisphaera colitermitum TaxID=1148786 RepID=UPI0005BB1A88|nr:glucose-6-phosphate isomerase [Geminisphaera colitermitum]
MSWTRFKQHTYHNASLGLSLDISRIPFPDTYLPGKEAAIQKAFAAMADLERGAIANPDENRMVGHYWLRNPTLAPTPELRAAITDTLAAIKAFAKKIHTGEICGSTDCEFTHLLVVGIGGSALGPQLVNHALGQPGRDKIAVSFFDNTDPDGIDYTLATLTGKLPQTLVVVISKSGGTVETRNGQLEAAAAFRAAGLDYTKHFVAVTGDGSKLDQTARADGWLARFPMWDWVGGRTSELSAVGLLPAALQGIDIDAFLAGAAEMDALTRSTTTRENPAALLALMWHYATDGRGAKDMVVLPYKDRLLLFSRYLQQLVMESLGKELDLAGNIVNQGIAVYGNKGSTDQHAYVQQLREGVNNFFVTFIEVLKDRDLPPPPPRPPAPAAPLQVEPGITTGDYLQGFYLGTRDALTEKDRSSLTLTVADVSPRTLGQLIALYERATGLYATLVGINAYHQPGVEAGKKAATGVIALKQKITAALAAAPGKPFTAEQLAAAIGAPERTELVYKVLEHLAANGGATKTAKTPWFESTYSA